MTQDTSYSDTNAPSAESLQQWFVLRDLKRANSKTPAYKELPEKGFEVFTPLKWIVMVVKGKRRRLQVPALSDLLFVHTDRNTLDPVIDRMPTLQYRYVRGAYCKPLVVRDVDMERFIRATTFSPDSQMYSIEEIDSLSIGKDVKIIGGPLEGVEAKIVNVRGARKKRIIVSIPDLIAAVVEVEPEYVVLK